MSSQYQIIKERIGAGSYATVYKVQRKIDKQILVLKKIPFYQNENKANIEDAKNEARILKQLEYKYIVKCFDSFEENNSLNIVMEYCERGDLSSFLKEYKQKNKYLSENIIWKFFIQISLGLAYIHHHKILHRDLKTLNIFLTKNLDVKIGDLGVAKILQNTLHAYTFIGTPFYLSPEICEEKPYNEKSDVWALGCILYELCTFKHPYNAKNQPALFLKIISGNYDPIGDNYNYSNDLKKMIESLLEKNYINRPSMKEIIVKSIFIEKANKLGLFNDLMEIINLDDNQKIMEKNMKSKRIHKITYIRPEKKKNTNPGNNNIIRKKINEMYNNSDYINNFNCYNNNNYNSNYNSNFYSNYEVNKSHEMNKKLINSGNLKLKLENKKERKAPSIDNIYNNNIKQRNSEKIKKNVALNNNNVNNSNIINNNNLIKHVVNKSSGGLEEIIKKNIFNNKIQKPIKQVSNIKRVSQQSSKLKINSSRSKEKKLNNKIIPKEKPSLDLLYNELLPEKNEIEMKIQRNLNYNKIRKNSKLNDIRKLYNSKSKSRSTSKSVEKEENKKRNMIKNNNEGFKKFINVNKSRSKSKDSNNKKNIKKKIIENPLNDFINDLNKKTLEATNKILNKKEKYENIPLLPKKNIEDDSFEIIDSDKLIFDNSNISDNEEVKNNFCFKLNNDEDSLEEEKVFIIQNSNNNLEKRKKLISQIEKFQKKFNFLYKEFWSYDKQINCKKFLEIYKEIDVTQKGDKTEEVINKLEDYVRKHLSDNLVPQFKEIFYKFLYYDIELKITKNELEKIPKECI